MTRRVSETEIVEFLTSDGKYLADYCFVNEFGEQSLCWISEDGRLFSAIVDDEDLAAAVEVYLKEHEIPVFESDEEAEAQMATLKRSVLKISDTVVVLPKNKK